MGNGIITNKDINKCNLNDFQLFQELGKGGFSSVLCVKKKKNNNYYALKIIPIILVISNNNSSSSSNNNKNNNIRQEQQQQQQQQQEQQEQQQEQEEEEEENNIQETFPPSQQQQQQQHNNNNNNNNNYNLLKNEIVALKLIGLHPFIISLKYAFHNYVNCYIVLDLVLGGNMRKKLDQVFPLDESLLSLVAYCIGSALQYIHEKNILHRDIKPENILLDQNGRPYLTDFGISYIGDPTKPNDLLVCSLSSGTIEYTAPEIYTKSHFHGTAADYWSLGVTLYELSYGITPFHRIPHTYVEYAEKRKYYEQNIRSSINFNDIVDIDHNSNEQDIKKTFEKSEIHRSILFQDFICQLLDMRIFYRIGGPHSHRPLNANSWIKKHKNFIHQRISRISQQSVELNFDDTFKSSGITMNSRINDNGRVVNNSRLSMPLQTLLSPRAEQYRDNSKPSSTLKSLISNYQFKLPDFLQITNQQKDVRSTNFYNDEVEEILQEYDYDFTVDSSKRILVYSAPDRPLSSWNNTSVASQSNDIDHHE